MLEVLLTVALSAASAVISFLIPEEFPLWVEPAVRGLAVLLLCGAAYSAGHKAGERSNDASGLPVIGQ
ncbi:hypothetical protein [Cupriavidus basilensis]|uniref:hypothetical protein n=1 Tax=Cupriavidus basilensis TaxID=68895 RepID=UPI0020A6556B|nr:hypothetical protein [Cupriavidus basilensis]MCP3024970.1 hypothetical protein [Cupriavidus basilensis]